MRVPEVHIRRTHPRRAPGLGEGDEPTIRRHVRTGGIVEPDRVADGVGTDQIRRAGLQVVTQDELRGPNGFEGNVITVIADGRVVGVDRMTLGIYSRHN